MIAKIRAETVDTIEALHAEESYRKICAAHDLDAKDAATLWNIENGVPVSAKNLKRIAKALGVPLPTRSYAPRPVTTKEQERRRAALGAQWRDVIDAGLATLEQKGAE